MQDIAGASIIKCSINEMISRLNSLYQKQDGKFLTQTRMIDTSVTLALNLNLIYQIVSLLMRKSTLHHDSSSKTRVLKNLCLSMINPLPFEAVQCNNWSNDVSQCFPVRYLTPGCS